MFSEENKIFYYEERDIRRIFISEDLKGASFTSWIQLKRSMIVALNDSVC